MRRSLLPQEMPTDDHLNVLKKAFQYYCEGNAVSSGLPIGYSVIVALIGLPIGYSVIVALTGLPIGYSVIVALTGLPIGYSVIVALTSHNSSDTNLVMSGYVRKLKYPCLLNNIG